MVVSAILRIWRTLLRVGGEKKRNVIFVSNDLKSDWMVKSGDDALFPRAELVDEFNRETEYHFWMMPFSRFLALLGAASTTVAEIADTAGTSFAAPAIVA